MNKTRKKHVILNIDFENHKRILPQSFIFKENKTFFAKKLLKIVINTICDKKKVYVNILKKNILQ